MALILPVEGQTFGQHVNAWNQNDTELYTLYTALGIAVGATNFGTFTGAILSDNIAAKALYQEIETYIESLGGAVAANIAEVVAARDGELTLLAQINSLQSLIALTAQTVDSYTVLGDFTTSGTVTLDSSYDLLSYVKTGKSITLSGTFRITSIAAASGEIRFTLPFTAASLSESSGNWSGTCIPLSNESAPTALHNYKSWIPDGSDYFFLRYNIYSAGFTDSYIMQSGGGAYKLPDNGGYWNIDITYIAA